MAYCLSYARALRGAACLPVFRHGKPSTDGLRLYVTEDFFRRLIMPSSSLTVAVKDERRHVCCRDRQPVCKNYGGRRTTRLRCWEESHGAKTACHGRYRWPRPRTVDPCWRCSGSRRSHPLLQQSRHPHPFVSKAFADSAYSAARVTNATSISIEIVRKIAGQVGFTVHPRRWVVERTFAWLGRNRRLAKDFEATLSSATAFLYAAAAMVLVRRMARVS